MSSQVDTLLHHVYYSSSRHQLLQLLQRRRQPLLQIQGMLFSVHNTAFMSHAITI